MSTSTQMSTLRMSSSHSSLPMSRSTRAKSMSKLYSGSHFRTSVQVPNLDREYRLLRFNKRVEAEAKPLDQPLDLQTLLEETKHVPNDNADVISREPSFTKFKIPYSMICNKRYKNSIRAYEAQLKHEIEQNIEFQSTAAGACYFMRCVAYSTFWPPLHNMKEMKLASRHFYRLNDQETARFRKIMNTNII